MYLNLIIDLISLLKGSLFSLVIDLIFRFSFLFVSKISQITHPYFAATSLLIAATH